MVDVNQNKHMNQKENYPRQQKDVEGGKGKRDIGEKKVRPDMDEESRDRGC